MDARNDRPLVLQLQVERDDRQPERPPQEGRRDKPLLAQQPVETEVLPQQVRQVVNADRPQQAPLQVDARSVKPLVLLPQVEGSDNLQQARPHQVAGGAKPLPVLPLPEERSVKLPQPQLPHPHHHHLHQQQLLQPLV